MFHVTRASSPSIYAHLRKELCARASISRVEISRVTRWNGDKSRWLMQKCLLANALQDPDNHHFVILSD
ncbi:hypothetical protein Dimus_010405, partial [Dionaea muscipula]